MFITNIDRDIPGSDTKTKIFLAAAHLFSQKGYNGVSMREISEKSGVSKPTIYYYFGNKEGIYFELLQTGHEYASKNVRKLIDMEMPLEEKLKLLFKRLFQMSLKHPEFLKLSVMLHVRIEDNPILKKVEASAEKPREVIAEMIEKSMQRGEVPPTVDPLIAGEVLTGVLTYFMIKQINSEKTILSDRLAEKIVDQLYIGLNG